jgi:hypothetical protein
MNAHEKRVEELLRQRIAASPALPEPIGGVKFCFATSSITGEDEMPPPEMRPPPNQQPSLETVKAMYIDPLSEE